MCTNTDLFADKLLALVEGECWIIVVISFLQQSYAKTVCFCNIPNRSALIKFQIQNFQRLMSLAFHSIKSWLLDFLPPSVDSGNSERINNLRFNFMGSLSGVTLDFLAQLVRWHPRHSQCLFLKALAVPGSPLIITFTLFVALKSALAVVSWPVVRPWFSTKMGGVS